MSQATGPSDCPVPRDLVRLGAGSALWTLALAAVGLWPTWRLGGSAAVAGMACGLLAALLGGWAGLAPLAHVPADPRALTARLLGGLAARFAVTLGLTVLLVLSGAGHARALVLWAAIGQALVLACDTAGLVARMGRCGRSRA